MSVRRYLILALVSSFIIPLALFFLAFTTVFTRHIEGDVNLLTKSMLKAVTAETAVRILDTPGRVLPTTLLLTDGERDPATIQRMLDALAQPRPEILANLLLDRDGRIIAASPREFRARGSVYRYQTPVVPGETSFSRSVLSDSQGHVMVEVVYTNGSRTAVSLIDLQYLSSKLVLLAQSSSDRLGIVDATGRYLICNDTSFVKRGDRVAPALLSDRLGRIREGGSTFFVSSAPVQGSQWRAIYFRSEKDALAPLNEFRNRVTLIMLFTIAVACLLTYVIWRSIAVPLTTLSARIESIAAGRYGERITESYASEFERIVAAFNSMADSIQRRDHELRLSEERYRLLFERTQAPAILVDPRDGGIRDANAAALAYYGYSGTEMRSLHMAQIEDAGTSTAVPPEGGTRTTRHRMKSGACRDVVVYTVPIENAEGMFLYFLVFDVTERRIAEERTAAALAEKTLLLKEIHHRVKNNLQIISSLLSMQADDAADATVAAALRIGQDRVYAMSLVHELTYQMADLSSIDIADYAIRLVTYLAAAYGIRREALAFETAPVAVQLEQAVPFGLILNEAVTNAFKYGKPAPGDRALLVTVGPATEGEATRFVVEDRGPGMREAGTGERKTLGLSLINTLVEQLSGRLSIGPGTGGKGLRVEVVFPLASVRTNKPTGTENCHA